MRWLSIRSTIGVSHLICNGDRPAPVPVGIVEGIMARETAPGLIDLRQECRFKRGEVVQINDGALCDQIGLFDCETDDERVVVLLDLLGREVRVTVPLKAIAACQQ